jgi:tetratricopeptide (TPR) repeat protein
MINQITAKESMSSDPITLFVAMPYTDLGEHAKWRKPQKVEAFYELVRQSIERKMDRLVELRIEKYSPESGLVIDGMFHAIHTADVFIADLTGSNANVFLELGIRYGVSKKVTILTTQEDKQPPFDLNQMRLVRYGDGPTQEAQDAIARIVFEELDTQKGGSPVLSLLDVEVVDRKQWEIVAGIRVEILIAESRRATDPQVRLDYVLEAIQTDPLSLAARIELARVLRSRCEFDTALRTTGDALKLFTKSAQLHKERGIILDRMTAQGDNRLDEAIEAYSAALKLDDKDADLHGCYGGVLRRKGLLTGDAARVRYLEAALEHYRTSMALDRHSTYAGLNVLRLLMLMTDSPNDLSAKVGHYMKRMYHLCAFEVDDSSIKAEDGHWWRMFDLADVLALMNEQDQALDTYQQAIELIPVPLRMDTLVSPIRSWKELLSAGNLNKQVSTNAEGILSLLEAHVSPSAN